ncbi:MAG: NAD(P)-dependent glycerol-3-phosphate dehydrogenase [Candidatus Paracaedibacteraceae bacterium]|nr:NAD(P)-dependent glycerol-3-phosphate dehydrogenase [Candidatus Paracaedibacteraceae bacterium]
MILVVGAGNFGMAIGYSIAQSGQEVALLSRNHERVNAINQSSTLPCYTAVRRPDNLTATLDIDNIQKARRIILAIPTQQVRDFIKKNVCLFPNVPLLLLQKGIEKETCLLPVAVVEEYLTNDISVLSGPNFAEEILEGRPTATTISAFDENLAVEWAKLFRTDNFRPYIHGDPIGAQLGGAIKNVIAIACGVVKGLGLGDNTMSATITRGLAEMVRLGVALGAKKETFLGLAGIGDLTLTCQSTKSRNLRFGMALAKKEKWEETVHGTVEGYHTAFSIEKIMHQYKIEMPISECVLKLIREQILPNEVVSCLMSRDLKREVF